jgi:phage tail sheath protein FI
MADYRTPNVYIEEQPATGPIAGVGTSNAAFLGAAMDGPINVPTKITNPTQFRDRFGMLTASGHYLALAVRGFFENGGTVAYVVRVGTAKKSALGLDDRGGGVGRALRVEAKKEGTAGDNIKVTVSNAPIVTAADVVRARRVNVPTNAMGAGKVVTVTTAGDAQKFVAGDVVTLAAAGGAGGGTSRVTRTTGNDIVLDIALPATAASTVRIADLTVGQKTFRIENAAKLEPGSAITFTQGGTTDNAIVDRITGEVVTISPGLGHGYAMDGAAAAVDVTSNEFGLVFTLAGSPTETFTKLSMDPRHSRFYGRIVQSLLVNVGPPVLPTLPSAQLPPLNMPLVIGATNLAGGADDNLALLGLPHYQAGLAALEKEDDVQLVAAPGRTDTGVQGALVAHCEKLKDRFAILDGVRDSDPLATTGPLAAQRAAVESKRGYAAVYYPWIEIFDPLGVTGDEKIMVPPSGHLAGIFARSDNERGVHKAPANELITGAINLEKRLDDTENGELNVAGINVLRIFAGKQRPNVWGARTTAPKDETPWRYLNVRRLFIYVERSIQLGIHWAVFEPNDPALWKKLDRTITEFLTRVWRSGALFGFKREQAFYVKVDEELNPESIRALGQVIIEIGIAPVRPAEFVIVRIGMWDGGASLAEA